MKALSIVLVAPPAGPALEIAATERLAATLGAGTRWLADGRAVELTGTTAPRERIDAALADGMPLERIDHAVLPAGERRKRLLVSDMDSTIITIECIDELADFAGIKPEVAAITARAMAGELDFAAALNERVALLAGLDASIIEEVCRTRLAIMPGAATLVATMRAHGCYTALVSGGFTQFTGYVRERLGFDHDSGNSLEIEAGRLTGRLGGPARGAAHKLETLRRLAAERGIDPAETLALGDGANDASMVEAAGLGVAYHAKPALESVADARIRHNDLTAVLFLQGYEEQDFVER